MRIIIINAILEICTKFKQWGLSTARRGHRRRSKWYRALDSRGMVSYQWPIVNGFNRKNALGQCQKYPGQSQDPETGWAVSESGKRPWPISRLPKILKRPNHLEMVGPFQDPENAHGQSRDRHKSWKRAQHNTLAAACLPAVYILTPQIG